MELYFLRHGRSVSRSDWTENDSERPLTEEGKVAMVHEAATLVRLGVRLDLVISSPLTRALQTAEIAAIGIEAADHLTTDERLGEGFGLKPLRKLLREHEGAECVLLVGHEPDLSQVVGELTGGRVMISKGGLVRVDVDEVKAGDGKLVWLLQADELIGGALGTQADATIGDTRPDRSESDEPPYRTTTAPTGEEVPLLDDAAPDRDVSADKHESEQAA